MALDPTQQYDSLMNDVSNRMATSRLTQRPSYNSNNQNARPTGVVKSRSNHNSPSYSQRRKTFSAARHYTPLGDYYDVPQGINSAPETQDGMGMRPANRPMSWHPSGAHPSTRTHHHAASYPSHQAYSTRNGQTWQGSHSTSGDMWTTQGAIYPDQGYPSSYAAQDDDDVVTKGYPSGPFYSPDAYSPFSQQPVPSVHPDPYSQYLLPLPQPRVFTTWDSSWTPEPNGQPPQQHEAVEPEEPELKRTDSTELVGMGLYDPPELDSSSKGPGQGKGLKLEEGWEPPSTADDDDASSEDEEEVEDPPAVVPQRPVPQPTVQQPHSMSGQSFFFDNDECKNEWWYHHLKQPQQQYTNLGQGWLR